jgi:hypothetical protein
LNNAMMRLSCQQMQFLSITREFTSWVLGTTHHGLMPTMSSLTAATTHACRQHQRELLELLFVGAAAGDASMVSQLLLNDPLDLLSCDDHGRTVLHYAAQQVCLLLAVSGTHWLPLPTIASQILWSTIHTKEVPCLASVVVPCSNPTCAVTTPRVILRLLGWCWQLQQPEMIQHSDSRSTTMGHRSTVSPHCQGFSWQQTAMVPQHYTWQQGVLCSDKRPALYHFHTTHPVLPHAGMTGCAWQVLPRCC